jgi:hypothetical protein
LAATGAIAPVPRISAKVGRFSPSEGPEFQGLRIAMGWPGGSGKLGDRLFYSVVDPKIHTDGMITGQDGYTLSRTTPITANTETKPHSRSKDPASILEHFATLPDPRRDHWKIHMLDEIVFMAICAVCGADSWQQIAAYSESKSNWLKTFLTLPGGVPSHDTFHRVFCLLDPLAFQACFSDWMTALMNRHGLISIPIDRPPLKPIAIDGKTQRGSARRTVGQSPLHTFLGVRPRAYAPLSPGFSGVFMENIA